MIVGCVLVERAVVEAEADVVEAESEAVVEAEAEAESGKLQRKNMRM